VAQGIEGLVHISEISDQHIDSPESVLSVGDQVRVKVIEVDVPRRRISLSMRQVGGALPTPKETEIEEEAAAPVRAVAAEPPVSTAAPVAEPEVAEVEETVAAGAAASAPDSPPTASEEAAVVEEEVPAESAKAEEEDVSLEAILEDLKRREGRSE
jgi:small subunit ribosomal protein S1